MRRVEVPGNVEDHFFLHSMPGRYEPIEEFLTDIILKNITCVVGFASPDEIRQKSPAYAAVLDGTVPWERWRTAASGQTLHIHGVPATSG